MSEKPVFIYLAAYASTADARADFKVLKDLGEALQEEEAALIVLSESPLEETIDAELDRADRSLERRVQDAAETLKQELQVAT